MEKKLVLSCEHMFFESYGRQKQSKDISPVFLRYYQLISEPKDDSKRYGVGIEKVTKDSAVTLCESQFIEDVFSCPNMCENFIKCLFQNKVTPVTLKDIVIDTIA